MPSIRMLSAEPESMRSSKPMASPSWCPAFSIEVLALFSRRDIFSESFSFLGDVAVESVCAEAIAGNRATAIVATSILHIIVLLLITVCVWLLLRPQK